MATPICVIYFPRDFSFREDGKVIDPIGLFRELNGWDGYGNGDKPSIGGYLWFCFFKDGITAPEFEVKKETNATIHEISRIRQLLKEQYNIKA